VRWGSVLLEAKIVVSVQNRAVAGNRCSSETSSLLCFALVLPLYR
jgi:hypothetical protein